LSRRDKLLSRFTAKPCPKDFSWDELSSVLRHLGYSELMAEGSRRRFVHDQSKHVIMLHRRHPIDTLLPRQIKQVIDSLKEQGAI